jgi:hypothetical protein
MSATGILQAATVIAKTTQTAVGSVLPCESYEYFTLFLDYVKGDETGVDVIVSALRTETGTAYPLRTWADSSGVNTASAQKIRLTATGSYPFIFGEMGSIDFLKVTQGGSNNDGTPTGTLAVAYTMA